MAISKKLSVGAGGVGILAVMQTMLELSWQNQMPIALVICVYLYSQGLIDVKKVESIDTETPVGDEPT